MTKIRIVSATRESHEGFMLNTALGRSLTYYLQDNKRYQSVDSFGYELSALVFPHNTAGLSEVYNSAIDAAAADPAVLVFVHDDVHLCDYYFGEQLLQALAQFDVVGLVGNRRRLPRQKSWASDGVSVFQNSANLSGAIAHGQGFPSPGLNITIFGPPRQEVKLLDGLLMAAHSDTLLRTGLRFDPQFRFHFYDLDFCRQAELRALRMGTWSISVVHESAGDPNNQSWEDAYQAYLAKYGE